MVTLTTYEGGVKWLVICHDSAKYSNFRNEEKMAGKLKESAKFQGGRERKAYVSAINVVLQPHSPSLYVELFNEIRNSDGAVKVRGQSAVMFGSCWAMSEGKPEEGLQGVIYKFFKLDANEPWFNVKTKSEAGKAEKSIISIPDYLKPHLQEFPFVFYPKGHRFYFVSSRTGQALSSKFMLDFFERIVELPRFAKFGSIKFTVEPERDTVNKILGMPRLKMLQLDIYQPNPDDQQSAEEKMQRRLKSQNVKRMQHTYSEATSEGIKPDDETKVLAKIASSNGKVVAKVITPAGHSEILSTVQHPLVEEMRYDSNAQTEAAALSDLSAGLHRLLVG